MCEVAGVALQPSTFHKNRRAYLPFQHFERSLTLSDVLLLTLKQSGNGFLHSLSLEKYFSFFLCVSKTKVPGPVQLSSVSQKCFYDFKTGELKAVYGFVPKVILSARQDEVMHAG